MRAKVKIETRDPQGGLMSVLEEFEAPITSPTDPRIVRVLRHWQNICETELGTHSQRGVLVYRLILEADGS